MNNLQDIIHEIKKKIIFNQNVVYDGAEYKPLHFTYWYNRLENKWEYSVIIQPVVQNNSIIDVSVFDIKL